MNDFLRHPIKIRSFTDENSPKKKVSHVSFKEDLEINNQNLVKSQKKVSIRIHISLFLAFFIFMLVVTFFISTNSLCTSVLTILDDNSTQEFRFQLPSDDNLHLEKLVYHYMKKFDSFLVRKLNRINLISYFLEYFHFGPNITLMSAILIIVFLSLLFSILSFSCHHQFFCFILVIIIFLTDKYLINIFFPLSAISLEAIVMCISIYTFCSMNFYGAKYSRKKRFFCLLVFMISASFCTLSRIEFLILFVLLIVIFINSAITRISFLFIFLFILIINFALLIVVDRFIGFPSITFNSFSIYDLMMTLFSSDFNGLVLSCLLLIPFFFPFVKYDSDKDYLYIISISFMIILSAKLHVSSQSDSFLARIFIIRFALILLLGKVVCFQKSAMVIIILLALCLLISMIFTTFELDDMKLYHFFVNDQ